MPQTSTEIVSCISARPRPRPRLIPNITLETIMVPTTAATTTTLPSTVPLTATVPTPMLLTSTETVSCTSARPRLRLNLNTLETTMVATTVTTTITTTVTPPDPTMVTALMDTPTLIERIPFDLQTLIQC